MVVIWSIPLLLTVLCASVLEQLSGNAAPITQIESPAFDARKYLPVGAVVSHPGKDVVFADIDGDGRREVVIFYNLGSSPDRHEANILVLKRTGSDYIRYWQDIFSDSWGFEPPTGVLDLNKNGKLQIVAYRKIGASCPGKLDIFESRDNTITRITGPWGDGGQCQLAEIKDLNGDGKPEIIVRVRKYGVNPDIYSWDGSLYTRNNAKFPQYYTGELQQLLESIHTQEPLPASARVRWCSQAVEIYLLQRRYEEAIQLCNETSRIIDDAHLTKPNYSGIEQLKPEQRKQIQASLELEKAEAKMLIHRLLGDAYKVSGKLAQAEVEYRRADEFGARLHR